MKKVIFAFIFITISYFSNAQTTASSYEYMQVTTIESLVPGGFGRSRMITTNSNGQLDELPLENFFSMGGINFGNVRFNDKAVTDKVNLLAKQGWELWQTTSAAESSEKNTGIFITRYMFRRTLN